MKATDDNICPSGTPEAEKLAVNHNAVKVRTLLNGRSIVLIGMMGAGKSSIGRRLAVALGVPFHDADIEIESAAGMTIEGIFQKHGEAHFREGEERVIKRLLKNGEQVLATGGGAVASSATRECIAETGISIWLNAPIDLLIKRVSRRDHRPLLKTADPAGIEAIMTRLLAQREAFYAQADLVFPCRDVAHHIIVDEIIELLAAYLDAAADKDEGLALKDEALYEKGAGSL